jgi:AcrR family transcriptional regulator
MAVSLKDMCAAKARTSDDAIVAAASAIVRKGGPNALTLRDLAAAVGVKAPSLYKRFEDRNALLAAVRAQARTALREALGTAAAAGPAGGYERLGRMARAWRVFALAEPGLYSALADGAAAQDEPDATQPLRQTLDALVGHTATPSALRALVSFLHGFATLEAAQPFRLGAGIDASFALGLSALFDGLVLDAAANAGQPDRT